jgi:hypothetical protein
MLSRKNAEQHCVVTACSWQLQLLTWHRVVVTYGMHAVLYQFMYSPSCELLAWMLRYCLLDPRQATASMYKQGSPEYEVAAAAKAPQKP